MFAVRYIYGQEGAKPTNPMAAVFGAGMSEWRRSSADAGADVSRGAACDRVDRAMGVAIEREEDRLARRLVVVASVAATAPIAGLLGTVCGVMATLSAIAAMPSPTLAAVAPGVAAALLPAAVGLVVGVPAVVAAKKNEADVARFMRRLKGFAAEFGAILSRQGEEQAGHTPRSR